MGDNICTSVFGVILHDSTQYATFLYQAGHQLFLKLAFPRKNFRFYCNVISIKVTSFFNKICAMKPQMWGHYNTKKCRPCCVSNLLWENFLFTYPKIQQTKMLVGSSDHKTYSKGRFKVIACSSNKLWAYLYYMFCD